MSNGTEVEHAPVVEGTVQDAEYGQAVSLSDSRLETDWQSEFTPTRLDELTDATDEERQAWRERSVALIKGTDALANRIADSKAVAQAYIVRLEDRLAVKAGKADKRGYRSNADIVNLYPGAGLTSSRVSQLRNVAKLVIDIGLPLDDPRAGWFINKGIMQKGMAEVIDATVKAITPGGGQEAAVLELKHRADKLAADKRAAEEAARQIAADHALAESMRNGAVTTGNGQDTASNADDTDESEESGEPESSEPEESEAKDTRQATPPGPSVTLTAEEAYERAVDYLTRIPEASAADFQYLYMLADAVMDRLDAASTAHPEWAETGRQLATSHREAELAKTNNLRKSKPRGRR